MITVPITGYSPYHADDPLSQNPYRQTLAKWGKATSVSSQNTNHVIIFDDGLLFGVK